MIAVWIIVIFLAMIVIDKAVDHWIVQIGKNEKPSRTEILELDWYEFMEWVVDSTEFMGVGEPYERWTEMRDGVPHYNPLPTQKNFWIWYQKIKMPEEKKKDGNRPKPSRRK